MKQLPREPQHVNKGAVERKRLLALLMEGRRRSCVLIQAPAGSGKTTLASQWRALAVTQGDDFAGMAICPGDDCERMADGLFACLDALDPALAREASFVYNRNGEARAPEAAAIALIRALAKHPRDLVLLIDDYHLVHDASTHRFVQMLLDFAPVNFHLLLVSRSAPPLSLARLRDIGGLLEIDFSELRFTLPEAEELLLDQGAELSSREVRVVHDMTDGWAAGLGLTALALRRRGARPTSELRAKLQDSSDFRAYFHRNVLADLSSRELDDLARLAAASRFDEGLCAALFGPEAGQALLERLRRDNLFLLRVEGVELGTWHRFHPLFREQLKERFESLPAAEREGTHAILGQFFARRGQLREAVCHWVAAGEVDQAADWVEQHAHSLFRNGQLRRLARAVAELPVAVVRARGSLRLWLAWSQLCHRQLAACRESIDALKATVSAGEGQIHLLLLEAGLALQQDDTEAASRLLPALESMDPADDAVLAGARRNILGWYHGQRHQGATARACLAGPHYLLASGEPLLDSAFGFLAGECLKGYSHAKEGDMREGERALRETLRTAERVLGPYCEAAAHAAGFLSFVLYEIDELPALRALLDPRMDLIERVGLPDAVICALIMRSRMHQAEGSPQEALVDVERLEELAQQRGLDRTLALALAEHTTILLKTGNLAGAEASVARLRVLQAQQVGRCSNAAQAVWWQAVSANAERLAAIGRDQEALDGVQAILASGVFPAKLQAQAQLHGRAAVLQLRLRREHEALVEIGKAWTIAQGMGLVRSMLDLGEEALRLGEQAARRGLLDEAAQFHLERVTQRFQRSRARVAPPPSPVHGRLSEREIAVVKALAGAMPNKRIAQALSISPDTVKFHLKNVYSKLGVYGRDAAVRRAAEIGYIAPRG